MLSNINERQLFAHLAVTASLEARLETRFAANGTPKQALKKSAGREQEDHGQTSEGAVPILLATVPIPFEICLLCRLVATRRSLSRARRQRTLSDAPKYKSFPLPVC
ncbi:uncharacterized protein RSE6_00670 [Rhynchosporium secalis]|uniref:Uncharacterized protein n=1 Tax=Rhynchosporium secalis TaxID=38038 RepID=A0A1E1LVW0_RHYSE|nr:uncharacterized protein RSE6_00670 [Rhynchosporium secalis]